MKVKVSKLYNKGVRLNRVTTIEGNLDGNKHELIVLKDELVLCALYIDCLCT